MKVELLTARKGFRIADSFHPADAAAYMESVVCEVKALSSVNLPDR